MNNKKPVLITIIVLLCITVPLTIIGYFTSHETNPFEENPNHELKNNGFLWFYNENDELLSKYECQTDVCDLATTIIDDDKYGINYYKEGTAKQIDVIENRYAFINDGALIYLYSVDTGTILQNYKNVKNYNTKIEDNIFILQDENDLWGAVSVEYQVGKNLEFQYDFIGLPKNITEDYLKSDRFIVLANNNWFIVDNINNFVSEAISYPIIDFNNSYLITKNENQIKIFSYQNRELLSDVVIKDYVLLNDFVGIIVDNSISIYNNLDEEPIKTVTLPEAYNKVEFNIENDTLNVLIDDNIADSIAINF